MAKSPVTAQSFLKNIGKIGGAEPPAPIALVPAPQPPAQQDAHAAAGTAEEHAAPVAAKLKKNSRAGLKHIGGYFDREFNEIVAILRARLNLDNSELIQRAIEEMYQRETAARKFGDR